MRFRRERSEGGERLEKILPATCLGEACLYFAGAPCDSYEDLLNADGASGGVDKPPLKDDASFALYGQVCLGGEREQLVAHRAEILKDGVNPMMLIALSGRYGDMPLNIQAPPAHEAVIATITSSE